MTRIETINAISSLIHSLRAECCGVVDVAESVRGGSCWAGQRSSTRGELQPATAGGPACGEWNTERARGSLGPLGVNGQGFLFLFLFYFYIDRNQFLNKF
jgi:hypothetical protein